MKKTTSENLTKRLARYGSLSLAVAGITAVNGQIVYHDIDPDFDGSSDFFLNMNPIDGITPGGVADNIDDFRIFTSVSSIPSAAIIRLERFNNNAAIASASLFTYPFALNSGYTISSANINWSNQQFQSLVVYSNCLYGNWCTATDQYLGLRFDINGNTHYGWAKLDADAATMTWVLKEFAFNATPDEPINAGQKVLGIENSLLSKVKIVALNKNIALYNLPQQTDYKVFNMSGQSVLTGKLASNQYVIEAHTISSGIYIIELIDKNTNALIRKKIVL